VTRTVLHYIDSDIFGGSEVAALHLLGALDRTRWKPVLLHHPERGVARLVEGARARGVETRAVARVAGTRDLRGVARLRRAIRAERPAVLHAHLSWPLACRFGVLAAWAARVPAMVATAQLYIEIAHAPGSGRYRQQRWMAAALDRIIAVSTEVRDRYVEQLGVPRGKLVVVPNGVPVPADVPVADAALRAELVCGRPGFVALVIARFHEQKGHAYLLEAAARVPDVTFVLAGDGPLRPEMERRARELGVAERCVFLGERDDVSRLLATADLFVLPSLFEGLPLSVLEAMAARRPIVASAVGGTDEAIEPGVSGLLVPPRDARALADAIARLRDDPALAKRLADAARRRVEREFGAHVTAGAVMRVYDAVAGAPPAGA
jgi:glycosyltransferase involved in cell wall biosynthesis